MDWYEDEAENHTYATVKVEEYDPVPFIMSHMENPLLELHCKTPVRDAVVQKSENGRWSALEAYKTPTIRRATTEEKAQALNSEIAEMDAGVHVLSTGIENFPFSQPDS